MARETEAKFRVESHEPVRECLRRLDAEPLGAVLETNHILDRPDGSLRRSGCGLRVRETVNSEGRRAVTLTFKGPVVAGPYKSREELEAGISDAAPILAILKAMGYVELLAFQKRRESWKLGDCRIELDQPPHIGLFVEIEGPDNRAIEKVQIALGLSGATHEKASYARMLSEFRDRHALPVGLISIENADR